MFQLLFIQHPILYCDLENSPRQYIHIEQYNNMIFHKDDIIYLIVPREYFSNDFDWDIYIVTHRKYKFHIRNYNELIKKLISPKRVDPEVVFKVVQQPFEDSEYERQGSDRRGHISHGMLGPQGLMKVEEEVEDTTTIQDQVAPLYDG